MSKPKLIDHLRLLTTGVHARVDVTSWCPSNDPSYIYKVAKGGGFKVSTYMKEGRTYAILRPEGTMRVYRLTQPAKIIIANVLREHYARAEVKRWDGIPENTSARLVIEAIARDLGVTVGETNDQK